MSHQQSNPVPKNEMLGAFATATALATCLCVAIGSLIGLSTWMLALLMKQVPLQF